MSAVCNIIKVLEELFKHRYMILNYHRSKKIGFLNENVVSDTDLLHSFLVNLVHMDILCKLFFLIGGCLQVVCMDIQWEKYRNSLNKFFFGLEPWKLAADGSEIENFFFTKFLPKLQGRLRKYAYEIIGVELVWQFITISKLSYSHQSFIGEDKQNHH